tara:strand:- start:24486 stop:25595 length:1110 start_codon:yes stop_codon:yes gene_type:complete
MNSGYEGIIQAIELAKSMSIPSQDLPWTLDAVNKFVDEEGERLFPDGGWGQHYNILLEPTGWSIEKWRAELRRREEENDRMWAEKYSQTNEQKLRKYIKKILLEDAYSFVEDGAKLQRLGTLPVTKQDEILPKSEMWIGRKLKQLFAKHADHEFLKKLNTVHWTGDEYDLKYLMAVTNKDELSATISAPGHPFSKPRRVSYGLWIKGKITYAANNMDHIHSGHRGDYFPLYRSEEKYFSEEELEKAKQRKRSSGINKVPRKAPYNFDFALERSQYSPRFLERFPYILDAKTFNPTNRTTNEALVDNWKPIGLIITDEWVKENVGKLERPGKHLGLRWKRLFIAQEYWNIPLYDINGNLLLKAPPNGEWP